MVSQENIDQQHESSTYWIIIGAILFVFLLIAWYAMSKVAVNMQHLRDNMRSRLGPVLIGALICLVIFFVVIFLINLRGKKEQQEKIKKKVNQPTT